MKKSFFTLLTLCLVVLFSTQTQAQDFADVDKSPMDAAYFPKRAAFRSFAKTEEARKADEPVIRVLYSRPKKNNRQIVGNLIKYNEWWRAGANESTEVMFFKDVEIGGSKVPAGRYTLHVKALEGKTWTIAFSKDLDGWGSYAYNADNDAATVDGIVGTSDEEIEYFSITFDKVDDGAHMVMGWDKTVVRVPIQF